MTILNELCDLMRRTDTALGRYEYEFLNVTIAQYIEYEQWYIQNINGGLTVYPASDGNLYAFFQGHPLKIIDDEELNEAVDEELKIEF